MSPKPTERTTAGIVIASEFTAKGIIPSDPSEPPPVKRTVRKFSRVNVGLVNDVHQPEDKMSSLVRNEVTTRPRVGTVHIKAITVTIADAIGEVNGFWPCSATSGLFFLSFKVAIVSASVLRE